MTTGLDKGQRFVSKFFKLWKTQGGPRENVNLPLTNEEMECSKCQELGGFNLKEKKMKQLNVVCILLSPDITSTVQHCSRPVNNRTKWPSLGCRVIVYINFTFIHLILWPHLLLVFALVWQTLLCLIQITCFKMQILGPNDSIEFCPSVQLINLFLKYKII